MSKDEPVTLVAVARAAGVSKTTASDALRDSGRVSERTKQRVAAVARRLGYTPNPAARSLRRARTGAIGLHLPEVLTRSEYYMSFVFGVVDQAARHNHDVTSLTWNPSRRAVRSTGSTASSSATRWRPTRWSAGCSIRACPS